MTDEKALRKRLMDAGIDLSVWGHGAAKTVAQLAQEIAEGETILEDTPEGLVRTLVVATADVRHGVAGDTVRTLVEDRQVFADGRARKRILQGTAVREKIRDGEDPREGIIRGITEELGIDGPLDVVAEQVEEEGIFSPSYPGLRSRYTLHRFIVRLSEAQYRPEGYVEETQKMTTYFVWEAAATG